MKAFMSLPDRYAERPYDPSIVTVSDRTAEEWAPGPLAGTAQRMAEAEAHAILRESESEIAVGSIRVARYGTVRETIVVERRTSSRHAHARIRPELTALADALRAFVAD